MMAKRSQFPFDHISFYFSFWQVPEIHRNKGLRSCPLHFWFLLLFPTTGSHPRCTPRLASEYRLPTTRRGESNERNGFYSPSLPQRPHGTPDNRPDPRVLPVGWNTPTVPKNRDRPDCPAHHRPKPSNYYHGYPFSTAPEDGLDQMTPHLDQSRIHKTISRLH